MKTKINVKIWEKIDFYNKAKHKLNFSMYKYVYIIAQPSNS